MSKTLCMPCGDYSDNCFTISPCEHQWCQACIQQSFTLGRYEANWPIRCCQPIDFPSIQHLLPEPLVQDLQVRIPEFETLPQHRIYCAYTNCHAFIPTTQSSTNSTTATCHACSRKTCLVCRTAQHENTPCPTETSTADQTSWHQASTETGCKKCPGCEKVMIEKNGGCAHVICPTLCNHNFCYYCLCEWKDCFGNCEEAVRNMHLAHQEPDDNDDLVGDDDDDDARLEADMAEIDRIAWIFERVNDVRWLADFQDELDGRDGYGLYSEALLQMARLVMVDMLGEFGMSEDDNLVGWLRLTMISFNDRFFAADPYVIPEYVDGVGDLFEGVLAFGA